MSVTIVIDQGKPCALCGAKGATQNGLCLECIRKRLERKKGAITMGKEQPNLFGERDFIINTLETERKALQDEVEATMSSIEKKEDKLEVLKERIENISSSIEAIRKAAKEGQK